MKRNHWFSLGEQLISAKETLQQYLQAKAQRIQRFGNENKFYKQNKLFTSNTKTFYREIGKGE